MGNSTTLYYQPSDSAVALAAWAYADGVYLDGLEAPQSREALQGARVRFVGADAVAFKGRVCTVRGGGEVRQVGSKWARLRQQFDIWSSACDFYRDVCQWIRDTVSPGSTVYLTGHGRGGAIVTSLAYMIACGMDGAPRDFALRVVTFGAPPTVGRNGAEGWADTVARADEDRALRVSVSRYVCGRDPVPQIGTQYYGEHVCGPRPIRAHRWLAALRRPDLAVSGWLDHERTSYLSAVRAYAVRGRR